MTALAVLIPVAILGLITWVVIGTRMRAGEPATLASAGALYAHVMSIVGTTMALIGGAILIKAVIGFVNLGYSYAGFNFSGSTTCSSTPSGGSNCSVLQPAGDFTPQRTQDLILAITLVVVGLAVLGAHVAISRVLARLPGGNPRWVHVGSLVAFTTLYGFAAALGLAAAAYGVIAYIAVPSSSNTLGVGAFSSGISSTGQPFGDVVGVAVLFVPAWIVAVMMLLRALRPGPRPTEAVAA